MERASLNISSLSKLTGLESSEADTDIAITCWLEGEARLSSAQGDCRLRKQQCDAMSYRKPPLHAQYLVRAWKQCISSPPSPLFCRPRG